MISVRVYRGGDVSEVDSAQISEVIGHPDTVVWVDVADPTADELTCIQQQFSLHPLAIEDVEKRHQRPKLDRYSDHLLIVAHDSSGDEIDCFVAPAWLVSVRESGDKAPAWAVDNATARFDHCRPEQHTSGFLLYVLLDQIVDEYGGTLENYEDELDALEEEVFAEGLRDERRMHERLFDQQRKLIELRRSVAPLSYVLDALRGDEFAWINHDTRTHLQDVDDHVKRATDSIEAQREILGNIVSAHLAMVSNNMSRVMKKMTSWGAIILGSALVAGIYGMNFTHMPELDWKYGYLYALSLMAAIGLAGYWYFKRKGWL